MSTVDKSDFDLEEVGNSRSVSRSEPGSEGSVVFSDADDKSWHSRFDSAAGGSCDESRFSSVTDPKIGESSDLHRNSSSSDGSVEVDLESGVSEIKVHLAKMEKDCRICHLSLESDNQESGIPIELGCSCKNDLAAAHRKCAETWFKIRGNKTCEICGATARNVIGSNDEFIEQWNETNNATTTASRASPMETQNFWHGHRFLNFLLACMVFAFVISWLLHFHVPP